MPAYRSEDEAEIRRAVVARLREIRPSSRIIHEINVCQGGNRIDVLCVGVDEIIVVEIKSKKDKIDRLDAQMTAMRSVAHHSIAALHEKFLVPSKPGRIGRHAAHYEKDGVYYQGEAPPCVRWREAWIYPIRNRMMNPDFRDSTAVWDGPDRNLQVPLPSAALDMLWREELAWLCGKNGIVTSARSTRSTMMRDLQWLCTGKELTLGICAALRARDCIEADPPHEWKIPSPPQPHAGRV